MSNKTIHPGAFVQLTTGPYKAVLWGDEVSNLDTRLTPTRARGCDFKSDRQHAFKMRGDPERVT